MTKKLGVLVGIVILVLAALTFVYFDHVRYKSKVDQIKQDIVKFSDPTLYSDSKIEKFNHIDQQSEETHQQALELSDSNQLDQAITLLTNAINKYEGFKGYHYFALIRDLALFYKRQGNSEKASELMLEVEDGQLDLLKQEQQVQL